MGDVHTAHCCVIHGCKYGDLECTVVFEGAKQEYPCEDCPEDDEELQMVIDYMYVAIKHYKERLNDNK